METLINAVTFEDGVAGKAFTLAGIKNGTGGGLKKIMVDQNQSSNWVKERFPDTAVVQHANEILDDHEIDLVIVPQTNQQPNLVAEIINSGKNVRIL